MTTLNAVRSAPSLNSRRDAVEPTLPRLEPRSYWEQINTSLWGSYLTNLELDAIQRAARLAGTPQAALEVGCEGGRWAAMLESQGWDMTCTDVNPEALEICRNRLERGRCIQVSPHDTTLPAEDDAVSLLLCMEVFPVVYNDWFIAEAWRVLQEGGVVVGAFLNLCSWKGLLHRVRSTVLRRFQWYHRTYPNWRAQVRKTGFELHLETGYSWMPFGRGSNHPLVPFAASLEETFGLRKLPAASPWVLFIAQKRSSAAQLDLAPVLRVSRGSA
jgi:SAM-dependent methyltransferase